MKLRVSPISGLNGTIRIPGSKSQSVRALLVATLAQGESHIHGLPESEDVNVAIQVIKDLGTQVKEVHCHGFCVDIISQGVPLMPITQKLWTGNSGITTRFLLPLLGLCGQKMLVDAGEQMKKRPMAFLENLRELGLQVNESWPLEISGELRGGTVQVDGLTSQYLSALLLSAPYAQIDMKLLVENLNERPYVELTLDWLREAGIEFKHEQEGMVDNFEVRAGQNYQPIEYTVPGDFSSASSFLVAGTLLPGELHLQGLVKSDRQGDRRLVDILRTMGADIHEGEDSLIISGGKPLTGLRVDANDIPDMVPSLAVLGTQIRGGIEIVNVPQARYKETDRIHSMAEGLSKMGAKIEEQKDGLRVWPSKLRGAAVKGYEDHRTIMALSIAGLLAEGETEVDTAEGINKTYPLFGDHMNQLGASLFLQQ